METDETKRWIIILAHILCSYRRGLNINKTAECCISLCRGIDLHGDVRYDGSQRDLLQTSTGHKTYLGGCR